MELLEKKNFDRNLDCLYGKFIRLIKEYDQECGFTNVLDHNLDQLQNCVQNELKIFEDEKLRKLAQIDSLLKIPKPETQEKINQDKEANQSVLQKRERAMDLVSKIDAKKKEIDDLVKKYENSILKQRSRKKKGQKKNRRCSNFDLEILKKEKFVLEEKFMKLNRKLKRQNIDKKKCERNMKMVEDNSKEDQENNKLIAQKLNLEKEAGSQGNLKNEIKRFQKEIRSIEISLENFDDKKNLLKEKKLRLVEDLQVGEEKLETYEELVRQNFELTERLQNLRESLR